MEKGGKTRKRNWTQASDESDDDLSTLIAFKKTVIESKKETTTELHELPAAKCFKKVGEVSDKFDDLLENITDGFEELGEMSKHVKKIDDLPEEISLVYDRLEGRFEQLEKMAGVRLEQLENMTGVRLDQHEKKMGAWLEQHEKKMLDQLEKKMGARLGQHEKKMDAWLERIEQALKQRP
jgi:hypothetical protein